MSDLNDAVEKLVNGNGQFVEIELNGQSIEAMLADARREDKKWRAKVKIKGESAYYTKYGESNSHKEEAVKRGLLNAFASMPK